MMRGDTLSTSLKLFVETCCACGTPFAIESDLQKRLIANKTTFYCPNGHSQSYVGETDAERARKAERKLETEKENTRFWREQEAKATRKAVRLQRRIERGVCPHCTRSFQNVKRHIATKHHDQMVTS